MNSKRFLRLALLGFVWWTATGLGACSLFKPEDPETGGGGTLIVGNYTDPDSTLNALVYGIRSNGENGGIEAYRQALADSDATGQPDGRMYRVTFDPLTISVYQSTGGGDIPDWTRSNELSFFQSYFQNRNPGTTRDLVWIEDPTPGNPIRNPNDALLYKRYLLIERLSNGTLDTTGSGFASLYFVKPQTRWVLIRWEDREDPQRPQGAESFGLLRLNNQ